MTSLQGYVKASFDELVEVFGQPTYAEPSGDGKVETEWEMVEGETVFTIYDWKEYDNGARSRSGLAYRWHIGGRSREAVDFVANRLNRIAHYA